MNLEDDKSNFDLFNFFFLSGRASVVGSPFGQQVKRASSLTSLHRVPKKEGGNSSSTSQKDPEFDRKMRRQRLRSGGEEMLNGYTMFHSCRTVLLQDIDGYYHKIKNSLLFLQKFSAFQRIPAHYYVRFLRRNF